MAARGSGSACKVLRMHRMVSNDSRTGLVKRLAGTAESPVRAATMAYGDGTRAACSPSTASATCPALLSRQESARPCRARTQFHVRQAADLPSTRGAEPGVIEVWDATVAG